MSGFIKKHSSSGATTTLSDGSPTLTIAIAEVTGNIVISVPIVNENIGEEDSGNTAAIDLSAYEIKLTIKNLLQIREQ